MKIENEIFEVEGGYKLANGNSESVETYESYEDAVWACEADQNAWANAEDAEEAEENSPVQWQP